MVNAISYLLTRLLLHESQINQNAEARNSKSSSYSTVMSHLEYMQSEASKNMEFHMQNMDNLQREANNTLTFLYLVVSASFSGALKLFLGGKITILAVALSCLCIYLTILAVCLVFGCMMAKRVKAPANEPKNLKIKSPYTSEEIQSFELENLQKRIEFNQARNVATGHRLNWVRVGICFSPIAFTICLVALYVMAAVVCRG